MSSKSASANDNIYLKGENKKCCAIKPLKLIYYCKQFEFICLARHGGNFPDKEMRSELEEKKETKGKHSGAKISQQSRTELFYAARKGDNLFI